MVKPRVWIEFADKRHDGKMAAPHFIKLAFQCWQAPVRPAVDEVGCSRFAARSVHVTHRATATTSLQQFDERRDCLRDAKMVFDSRAAGVSVIGEIGRASCRERVLM